MKLIQIIANALIQHKNCFCRDVYPDSHVCIVCIHCCNLWFPAVTAGCKSRMWTTVVGCRIEQRFEWRAWLVTNRCLNSGWPGKGVVFCYWYNRNVYFKKKTFVTTDHLTGLQTLHLVPLYHPLLWNHLVPRNHLVFRNNLVLIYNLSFWKPGWQTVTKEKKQFKLRQMNVVPHCDHKDSTLMLSYSEFTKVTTFDMKWICHQGL